jgi:hypothetical protein
MKIYQDTEWQPWRFKNSPRNLWESKEQRIKYMEWLEEKFQVNSIEDWIAIGRSTTESNHGKTLMEKYGSFNAFLEEWSILRNIKYSKNHENPEIPSAGS